MRIKTSKFLVFLSTSFSIALFFILVNFSIAENSITENFDTEPGWQGFSNKDLPQNFGFSNANKTGGAVGEIGGIINRSTKSAYYGDNLENLNLNFNVALKVTGKFAIKNSESASGALFGWFNNKERGWPPKNFLGFQFDGESTFARIYLRYGTATGNTGSLNTGLIIKDDNSKHDFILTYDPKLNGDNGAITFSIDGGSPLVLNLASGDKARGINLNRFGLSNIEVSGNNFEVYFDDIKYNNLVETFDFDPKWGLNNILTSISGLNMKQDFGYSNTNYAGGSIGELGGVIWRSERGAYYAKEVNYTMNNKLTASGRLALKNLSGTSGIHFGWFNSEKQGWRPINSIAFRIIDQGKVGKIYLDYATSNGLAGGKDTGLNVSINSSYNWELIYDPNANSGDGVMTFSLDGGSPVTLNLAPGHKAEGANFNRFGLFNQQNSGLQMEIYFDNLVFNNQSENFNVNPNWIGVGNKRTAAHQFGFSNTNYAGSSGGEIGGTIVRSVKGHAYYASTLDGKTYNLTDLLTASGKLSFSSSESASGALFGWFNNKERGWPPKNFLGFQFDGESTFARIYLRYGTATGNTGSLNTGWVIEKGSKIHNWTLVYDPVGNGGAGSLTMTLDGQSKTLNLISGYKNQETKLNRFGMTTIEIDGNAMSIYFDDLIINGKSENFKVEPGQWDWEGYGNKYNFIDYGEQKINNFGFKTSNFAGINRNELGGRIYRKDNFKAYYADNIGSLNLDNKLTASGSLLLAEAVTDGGFLFGWFNSETLSWPPKNFMGIFIDSFASYGKVYIRYGTSLDSNNIDTGFKIYTDNTKHNWNITYDSNANSGAGAVTLVLDGQSKTLNLTSDHRSQGATFNRFGMGNISVGGGYITPLFDDLNYTAQ